MDSYIVSALKYRPSTFQSVVGQHALTTTLKNAIKSNKLAHAYLFCGPRGVGKTTCARIFAKTINCENLTDAYEACNNCPSCRNFNEQRSFNIHELDAASNNSVDDIRALTDQVRIPPQIGRYSIYIIDEVHMLSQGAFNAFLKTLEEPPPHAIFILATTEKHKIIPTILSRCQIYDFNRISITDTVNHLKHVATQENVTIDDNALNIIAQKSDGGMRDALSIFDQLVSFCGNDITYQSTIENLNVLDYEYYFQVVNKALAGDVSGTLLIFNEVLNKGFDAHHFITGFSSHLRDVLVSKDPATLQLLEVGADIGERYRQQAAECSTEFIFKALAISNECDLNYRLSKNKRLLVELALIKIAQLTGDKKKTVADNEPPVTIQKIAVQPTVAAPAQSAKPPAETPAAPELKTAKSPAASPIATQQPAAPPAPAPPKIQAPVVSISISSAPEKTVENKPASVADAAPSAKRFTADELLEKWKAFSEKPELDSGTKAFLASHLPSIISEKEVLVLVDNKFQENELVKMGVLNFLRKELGNSEIRLKIELKPETELKKHQTPQEIYNRMATDFPVLEQLRKKLEMEVD